MKKVFIFMVAAFMMAAGSYARVNNNETTNFNLSVNLKEIRNDLSLNSDQAMALSFSTKELKKDIANIAKVTPEKRQAKLSDAVFENLSIAHTILSEAQYRQYLTMLNTKFNESGLNSVLFGYELAAE